ncbi:ergosterol biosynthetic protein 28 homolog [Petromyzon marinus]|uniref:ergosterol biosynthetic protein 28 homolog n=1 Tax=Petromyzon marinus TaxID=7757 RepID=UPI003F71BED1
MAGEGPGRVLSVLRAWLLIVALMALGNTIQTFRNHSFLSTHLYTGSPNMVNGLHARAYGVWTMLSSIVRLACAIDITNKSLYLVCLSTFVLALGHFLSEAFVYNTALLTVGLAAPLIVAGSSLVAMLIGLLYLNKGGEVTSKERRKKAF